MTVGSWPSAGEDKKAKNEMRVYFYCRDEPFNLQEDVVTLAEGLKKLGVPFYGSCNYWRQSAVSDDFLIKHDPDVSPDDCDVVVVSYTWSVFMRPGSFEVLKRPLPEGLFKKGRRYVTVCMDNHDGYWTESWEPEYRKFDLILRSKLNRRAWHPENMRPWVLGFTNRIVQATSGALSFAERRRVVSVNFGASHPYGHGARIEAEKKFLPQLEKIIPFDTTKDDLKKEPSNPYERLMWEQTGMRFSQNYYNRLKGSQAVACFCGELIPPMPWNPQSYMVGGNKAKLKRHFFDFIAKFDLRPRRSIQWDSFRAWEAWVAGCVVINLDLEMYGVDLPVMPENWKHYIGVDLAQPKKTLERIKDEPEILGKVAVEGHDWVIENYSPAAMARRFLELAGGG